MDTTYVNSKNEITAKYICWGQLSFFYYVFIYCFLLVQTFGYRVISRHFYLILKYSSN